MNQDYKHRQQELQRHRQQHEDAAAHAHKFHQKIQRNAMEQGQKTNWDAAARAHRRLMDQSVRPRTTAPVLTFLVMIVIGAIVAAIVITFVVPSSGSFIAQDQQIALSPNSGAAGASITVNGRGFAPGELVDINFQAIPVGSVAADQSGSFTKLVSVPQQFAVFNGQQLNVTASGRSSVKVARAPFTVR